MPTITVQARAAASVESGDIVVIRCAGVLLPAPEGNADTAAMLKLVRSRIADLEPAGVVFDLCDLVYSWGDHIGGLAHAVVEHDPVAIKPTCVAAKGSTAAALQPLFRENFIFGMYGIPLVKCVDDAIAFVRGELVREAGG